MKRIVLLALLVSFFVGCDSATDTTTTVDSSDITLDFGLTDSNGTYSCASSDDTYDTVNLDLVDATITFANCTFDNVIWSGDNSTVTFEDNSSVVSFDYNATDSTLNAAQSILDLISSSDLTESLY